MLPDQYFLEAISCILESACEPLSEYQLIQSLNEQGWALSTSALNSLSLFNTHFVVYNGLYHLQEHYLSQNRYLEISALSIILHQPVQNKAGEQLLAEISASQALRDYYLDISNLENASEESVKALLNQFWESYAAMGESAKAFHILGLEVDASYKQVKQRYRTLAMEHHPDRGGDASSFQQINWAFGLLQRYLSKTTDINT